MKILYASSFILGFLGVGLGVALMSVQSALEAWWSLAAIFSGGMLGLFLLGYLTKRVKSIHASIGVTCGVILIAWMSSNENIYFHKYLTIVFGTIAIFLIGFLSAIILRRHSENNYRRRNQRKYFSY